MKTFTRVATSAAFAVTSICSQAGEGATAPYNEAVRTVDGKRMVEVAPFPKMLRYVVERGKTPAELSGMGLNGTLQEVETPMGLMDCNGLPYYDPKICSPSTYGREKRMREWAVKLNGHWQLCIGRLKPTACIPMVQDGVLRALPTPELE